MIKNSLQEKTSINFMYVNALFDREQAYTHVVERQDGEHCYQDHKLFEQILLTVGKTL